MTIKEAATVIGCSPQQVRHLIRSQKLAAIKTVDPIGYGYFYNVRPASVKAYAAKPQLKGWPRGVSRNNGDKQ